VAYFSSCEVYPTDTGTVHVGFYMSLSQMCSSIKTTKIINMIIQRNFIMNVGQLAVSKSHDSVIAQNKHQHTKLRNHHNQCIPMQ